LLIARAGYANRSRNKDGDDMDIHVTEMPRFLFSLPMTRLVHENFSVIMAFAFSRKPLERYMERFAGEWKYLRKALFDIAEEKAEKACLELALFLRLVDDEQDISGYYKQIGGRNFGRLILKNEQVQDLQLRDVCNKIIHAKGLSWEFSGEADPILICHSQDQERWVRAEVDLFALAGFCGGLMS
jgi:hypothetical protein